MATASAPRDADSSGRPEWAAAARTEELYALYGRTVSALCGALLRNRAEAEDAAQQTFLSAHRALLNGSEPREPAAWLAAIARNECRARIAQRTREPVSVDRLEAAPARDDLYADAVARADLVALRRAIDTLAPKQREALLLREFRGLSYEELAAALAVSGGAVESLLFRARQRLRTLARSTRASLAGAPWLDLAARVLAGGGGPVAAKVAVLGVGAVAVTGGAVVAPRLVDRPHPAPLHHATTHRERARRQPTHHVAVVRAALPVARVIQVDRTIAPAAAPERSHRGTGGGRRRRGSSGHDESTVEQSAVRPSDSNSGPSSRDVHEAAPSGSGPGPSGGHDSHSGSSDDGRVDAAVVEPTADGSGSGSSGDDGGSGSSGRDGGGSATTTTATTVTTDTSTTTDGGGGGGGDDGSGGHDGGH